MTSNSAIKRAARAYGHEHSVSYRAALQAVSRSNGERFRMLATRVLIEAIEGCGIRHWADVNHWDGWSNAVITDLGGETFTLDVATITPSLLTFLDQNPDCGPLDIDGSLADEFVQLGLFGLVIYRSEISKRPKTAHHRATASL